VVQTNEKGRKGTKKKDKKPNRMYNRSEEMGVKAMKQGRS